MSYVRRKPEAPESLPELVNVLADEIDRGPEREPTSEESQQDTPEIIEEMTSRGIVHVTVIWNRWADLAIEKRGQVILDAYRRTAPDMVQKISIAMGLSRAEAMRLGIAS